MLHDAEIEYEEVKALEFQPKYDINVGNSDVHEQRNRQDLIDRAVPEDGHAVEQLAKERFENSIAALPLEMRTLLSPDSCASFEKSKYFIILKEVVDARLAKNAIPRAAPKVDPNVNCEGNPSKRYQREMLLAHMTQEDCQKVDEEIRSQWTAERDRADPALQALFPEEAPQSIWDAKYYDIAHTMFSSRLTVHDNTGLSQDHSCLSQDHADRSQEQSSLISTARSIAHRRQRAWD